MPTPITIQSLLGSGFEKRANMFKRGDIWIQLHPKGHTWSLSHVSLKYSKDVKSIEEIEEVITEIHDNHS